MLRGQNLAAIIASAKAATEDQRKAIALALANVAKANAAKRPGIRDPNQHAVANAGASRTLQGVTRRGHWAVRARAF
jgi:hypothetical protein